MKKTFLIGVGLLITFFAVFLVTKEKTIIHVTEPASKASQALSDATVSVNKTIFKAIFSDTEELRQNGLSGYTGLANDEVMVFIFEYPDLLGFWMKDMLFSIDMVWLDSNKKVVAIEKNVAPETFPQVFEPQTPALYVLEFNAGTAEHIGLKIGDTVSISSGK